MEGSFTFVGIDVSKARLDVYVAAEEQVFSVDNVEHGYRELASRLPAAGECLVVVESTGVYQRGVVMFLVDHGHRVAVVNPKRVREFARASGNQAKTDRIDARILARFGEKMQPREHEQAPEKREELRAHVLRRRQLVELRKAEKNHREASTSRTVFKNIQKVISVLDQQIREIERQIEQLVESNDQWTESAKIIQSVKGVGAVLTSALLTDLPELGTLNRKEIAALVGLAPYNDDSGTQKGKRRISGGRIVIRNLLYMAARAATRCNPPIKEFYERLLKAGKANKVAIVACMRKLLTVLNHLVKTKTLWNPNHAQ